MLLGFLLLFLLLFLQHIQDIVSKADSFLRRGEHWHFAKQCLQSRLSSTRQLTFEGFIRKTEVVIQGRLPKNPIAEVVEAVILQCLTGPAIFRFAEVVFIDHILNNGHQVAVKPWVFIDDFTLNACIFKDVNQGFAHPPPPTGIKVGVTDVGALMP